MRLHLKLSASQVIIPYNYTEKITSRLHQWLGENNCLHDAISLYSFSSIKGTDMIPKKGYVLQQTGHLFISVYELEVAKKLISAIQQDPELFCGMQVTEMSLQEPPQFTSDQVTFKVASPVFIKKDKQHYTFNHPEANQYLTQTLHTKLRKAGLSTEGCSVAFNTSYPGKKTKLIKHKKFSNQCSICPVTITGSSEQIAFAWSVGVGNSTGIGFGSLC